jgi:hypothetical protein
MRTFFFIQLTQDSRTKRLISRSFYCLHLPDFFYYILAISTHELCMSFSSSPYFQESLIFPIFSVPLSLLNLLFFYENSQASKI